MSKLRLSMACWNYDRTRALLEERVPIDGIELTYLNLVVEETFFRMLRHREFDVAEMSFSTYLLARSKGDWPYRAVPRAAPFDNRPFTVSRLLCSRTHPALHESALPRESARYYRQGRLPNPPKSLLRPRYGSMIAWIDRGAVSNDTITRPCASSKKAN